jgi:hypothetical protein
MFTVEKKKQKVASFSGRETTFLFFMGKSLLLKKLNFCHPYPATFFASPVRRIRHQRFLRGGGGSDVPSMDKNNKISEKAGKMPFCILYKATKNHHQSHAAVTVVSCSTKHVGVPGLFPFLLVNVFFFAKKSNQTNDLLSFPVHVKLVHDIPSRRVRQMYLLLSSRCILPPPDPPASPVAARIAVLFLSPPSSSSFSSSVA